MRPILNAPNQVGVGETKEDRDWIPAQLTQGELGGRLHRYIILCDQTEIVGEILAILAEQMLRSPLLPEVSQCLEKAILAQVQFIALPLMGSAIAPVCL